MDVYDLPTQARINGVSYPIQTDFRKILRIIAMLNDPALPPLYRFQGAMALFYFREIPKDAEGWEFLQSFLGCGLDTGGPRLMDWHQDADAIVADVNAVAGQDVRAMGYLHWWSFVSLFQSVGPGQLSLRVGIRDKLRRGKRLEDWEREYLCRHRDKVVLREPETDGQKAERKRLERLLDGGTGDS